MCKKLEVGTIVNWDRNMLIKEAGLSCGSGGCFAGLSFGSCKKHEVVIAGLLSGTESCLIVEAGPSFVSDFRGIVQKVA